MYGRAVKHFVYALAAWKRSAKRTANWDFAIAHSLGGIFHAFSDLFKTRYRVTVLSAPRSNWVDVVRLVTQHRLITRPSIR